MIDLPPLCHYQTVCLYDVYVKCIMYNIYMTCDRHSIYRGPRFTSSSIGVTKLPAAVEGTRNGASIFVPEKEELQF